MEYYHPEPTISQEIEGCPFGEDGGYEKIDIVDKSSVRQVVSKGLKSLGPSKALVIVAQGKQTSKAVTCAEIIKAKKTNAEINQVNRVTFVKTTETYDPLLEGLEPIRVTRSIPLIHILLSMEKLDEKLPGYQKTSGDGRKYGKKVIPSEFLA